MTEVPPIAVVTLAAAVTAAVEEEAVTAAVEEEAVTAGSGG
jgi:hypothetical protein